MDKQINSHPLDKLVKNDFFKEIINLLDNRFGRDIMKCIVKLPFSKKYIDLINIHLIGELFRRFNHNNFNLKDKIEILKILKIYMTAGDTITEEQ